MIPTICIVMACSSFSLGVAIGAWTASLRMHRAWEKSNDEIFAAWQAQIDSR